VSLNNLTASGNGSYGAFVNNSYGTFAPDVLLTGASTFNDNGNTGLYVDSYGVITAANLMANRNGGTTFGFGAFLTNQDATSAKSISLTGSNAFQGNWSGNLYLQSEGAISASNVTSIGSGAGIGATLYNSTAPTPQKVTLTGTSTFDDNYNHGLEIESLGAISASNLRASGNGTGGYGHGVFLHNYNSDAAQPVTLTGNGLFSENNYHGLIVQSKGAITAANLTAQGNGGTGAYLNNSSWLAPDDSPQKITLTGANLLSGNYDTNLLVESMGAISVSSLTASGSTHGYGASLRNSLGDPSVPQNLTLSGTSTIDDNYGTGLLIYSLGAVTLGSISASSNGIASGSGDGISVDNGNGMLPRGITLSGTYQIHGNEDTGLLLRSLGAIKVNNVTSSGNGHRGLYLFNGIAGAAGGIALTGSTTLEDNARDGLYAYSYGAITAANLTATDNGDTTGYGAMLINSAGAGTVKLTGTNVFSGNYSGGLYIESLGAISLSSLTASSNTHGKGVEASNSYNPPIATSPGITLSGTNVFNDNNNEGLYLSTYGAITASNVTASRNGVLSGSGASLSNSSSVAYQPVKLTGTNTYNDNYYAGLLVYSRGAISISSLTTLRNTTGMGASLRNNYGDATGGVTLSGTNRLEDNGQNGLYLWSFGPVTINSLTANGNGLGGSGSGASITNDSAATPQPVKLTGTNTFNDNDSQGLAVGSWGAITVNNLSASRNAGGEGASLWNDHAADTSSAVMLTGTNVFNDNWMDGLTIDSYGAITINNLTAGGNGTSTNGYGAYLVNTGGATPQAVKLTGTNTFNGNYDGGLGIAASGAIAVNNLSALDNAHADGVTLDNQAGSDGVTLTGTNTISDNFGHGLAIRSTGAVSATRLTADGNLMYGLYILGPADSITLTCGSFTGNGTRGIYAVTDGLLSLIGVISSGNAMANSLTYDDLNVVRNCPL
jgi:putative surface-exposed virulence protein